MAAGDSPVVIDILEPCYEGEEMAGTVCSEPRATDACACSSAADENTVLHESVGSEEQEPDTALKIMWQRLAGRGQIVAERMNIDMHKGAAALDCDNRDGALIQAFKALDSWDLGMLEVNALRALVTLDDPHSNAVQAQALLQEMDLDKDGKVSLADWKESWEPFRVESSDLRFYHAICAVVHGLSMPVDYDPSNSVPRNPSNNEEYLRSTILNVLQQGLTETLEFMMDAQLKTATELWDEDGFLPKHYRQSCPVRFLGEWLLKQKKPPPPEEEDPLSCDWNRGVPEGALTTTMRMKVAFMHLDTERRGFVSISDARSLLESFTTVTTKEGVAEMIAAMDLFGLEDMNLEEFMELLRTAFHSCTADQINSCLSVTILAYFLSTKARAEQVRCLFEHMANLGSQSASSPEALEDAADMHAPDVELHQDDKAVPAVADAECESAAAEPHSTTQAGPDTAGDCNTSLPAPPAAPEALETESVEAALTTSEAGITAPQQPDLPVATSVPADSPCPDVLEWASVQAIARRHLHTFNPSEVAAAVGSVRVDHSNVASGAIDEAAFSEVVQAVYKDASNLETANEFAVLMSGAVEVNPAQYLAPGLQAHVKNLSLYGTIAGASVAWVLQQIESEDVSEVIGVDCRTEEEFEVSTILEAILCEALPNPSAHYGYEADPEGLEEVHDALQMSLDAPTEARPVVVAFCLDGSRSLVVASQLIEQHPGARIVALTGGLIAWYNAGAPLEDPDGQPTTELHPGFIDALQDYIEFVDEDDEDMSTDVEGGEAE